MKPIGTVLVLAFFLVAAPNSATAVPITRTFLFEASDFTPPSAPTDPVMGRLTATFEAGAPMSSPIGAVSASLSIAGVSFDADNVLFQYLAGPTDVLQFGGAPSGLGLEDGTVDFLLEIEMASGDVPIVVSGTGFQYGDTDLVSYKSTATTVTLVPMRSVPEPATAALVAAVLLVPTLAGRRRRPATA